MCVRRKVKCCGTKPRCSICVRKGDVCVYSIKRRPGPRLRLWNVIGSQEAKFNNPTTGKDRYNTRRMSATDAPPPSHVMQSVRRWSLPEPETASNVILENGTEKFSIKHESLETDTPVLSTYPRDAKRACNASRQNEVNVSTSLTYVYPNNNTAKNKPLVRKLKSEQNENISLPLPVRMDDGMFDLMNDNGHLLPEETIKLDYINTESFGTDTSLESGGKGSLDFGSFGDIDKVFGLTGLKDDETPSSTSLPLSPTPKRDEFVSG